MVTKKLYEEGVTLRSISSHLERINGDSSSSALHRLLNGVRGIGCGYLIHRVLERPAEKRGRVHIDEC